MCSCRKDDALIMNMTTKEFLETANEEMSRKVWEHYGKETQKKKFIEELSELITALAKEDRRAMSSWVAVSKGLQGSQMKHIAIVHRTIKKSYQMHLRQLKRIYHFKEAKENDT